MGIGTTELIIVLVIVMLLFGGSKLPELARSLGSSIREFKKAQTETVNPAIPSGDEAGKPKFCEGCGGQIPEGAAKCPKCNS